MGGGSDLQKLSGPENVTLGIVTGIMSKSVNYPFLSWKNTVQQGLPISFNPRIVYRGLPMACLNLGGTNAVQFGSTGLFQKILASSGFAQDQVQVGGAFLGGAASGIPCSIWELCMIQQQRFGGSILGTPAQFIKEYGATSLTRGFTMTIGRCARRRLVSATTTAAALRRRPAAPLRTAVRRCSPCRCWASRRSSRSGWSRTRAWRRISRSRRAR